MKYEAFWISTPRVLFIFLGMPGGSFSHLRFLQCNNLSFARNFGIVNLHGIQLRPRR